MRENKFAVRVMLVLLAFLGGLGVCSEGVADSGFVRNDGAEIYYEVYGEGEPILLLAGLASDSKSWGRITEELARTNMVIVLDNRGCGRTQRGERPLTVACMAADAEAVLRYLRIEKTAVLGHSMGGFIALDLALSSPELVSGLILVATSAQTGGEEKELLAGWADERNNTADLRGWYMEIFSWLFTPGLMKNDEITAAMLEAVMSYPYRQSVRDFTDQISAILEFAVTDELGLIDCPTLIICGAEDRLFPPAESMRILKKIPESEAVVIDGAAHSVHSEQPDKVVAAIRKFL